MTSPTERVSRGHPKVVDVQVGYRRPSRDPADRTRPDEQSVQQDKDAHRTGQLQLRRQCHRTVRPHRTVPSLPPAPAPMTLCALRNHLAMGSSPTLRSRREAVGESKNNAVTTTTATTKNVLVIARARVPPETRQTPTNAPVLFQCAVGGMRAHSHVVALANRIGLRG